MKKHNVVLLIISLVIIDLIIKYIVSSYLTNTVIIKDFFSLIYVENKGASFSILANRSYLIILISVICLIFIIHEIKNNLANKIKTIAYSLILSGLLGNLINRLVNGYVIDYLSFKIFGYNYPVFNVADILIVVGTFIIIIKEFRGDKLEICNK